MERGREGGREREGGRGREGEREGEGEREEGREGLVILSMTVPHNIKKHTFFRSSWRR